MVVERAFEILAHKVGVAVRICQRQVEKATGKGSHKAVFTAFDSAIQAALRSRDQPQYASGAPADPLWEHYPWATSASNSDSAQEGGCSWAANGKRIAVVDALIDERCTRASGSSEEHNGLGTGTAHAAMGHSFEELLKDRLQCIEKVLRLELRAALEGKDADISHADILRRKVASHPRGPAAALLVSALSLRMLRQAQRSCKLSGSHAELLEGLGKRVSVLEKLLRSASSGSLPDSKDLDEADEGDKVSSDSQLNARFLEALSMQNSSTAIAPSPKLPAPDNDDIITGKLKGLLASLRETSSTDTQWTAWTALYGTSTLSGNRVQTQAALSEPMVQLDAHAADVLPHILDNDSLTGENLPDGFTAFFDIAADDEPAVPHTDSEVQTDASKVKDTCSVSESYAQTTFSGCFGSTISIVDVGVQCSTAEDQSSVYSYNTAISACEQGEHGEQAQVSSEKKEAGPSASSLGKVPLPNPPPSPNGGGGLCTGQYGDNGDGSLKGDQDDDSDALGEGPSACEKAGIVTGVGPTACELTDKTRIEADPNSTDASRVYTLAAREKDGATSDDLQLQAARDSSGEFTRSSSELPLTCNSLSSLRSLRRDRWAELADTDGSDSVHTGNGNADELHDAVEPDDDSKGWRLSRSQKKKLKKKHMAQTASRSHEHRTSGAPAGSNELHGDECDASKAGRASSSRGKGVSLQPGEVGKARTEDAQDSLDSKLLECQQLETKGDDSYVGSKSKRKGQAALQTILETAITVLQARIPKQHARFRWVRDQLKNFDCGTDETLHVLVSGVLAKLEHV